MGTGPGLFFEVSFPQLLGWACPLGCPLPRESSGFPPRAVSLTQGRIPGHDKHLVLQGKAGEVRGEAVGLCLVRCQLWGSEGLPAL